MILQIPLEVSKNDIICHMTFWYMRARTAGLNIRGLYNPLGNITRGVSK